MLGSLKWRVFTCFLMQTCINTPICTLPAYSHETYKNQPPSEISATETPGTSVSSSLFPIGKRRKLCVQRFPVQALNFWRWERSKLRQARDFFKNKASKFNHKWAYWHLTRHNHMCQDVPATTCNHNGFSQSVSVLCMCVLLSMQSGSHSIQFNTISLHGCCLILRNLQQDLLNGPPTLSI